MGSSCGFRVRAFALAAAALGVCLVFVPDHSFGQPLLVRHQFDEAERTAAGPSAGTAAKSGPPPAAAPGVAVAAQASSRPPETSTVEMLCSRSPPPRVAICVHGTARSFAHALVHRSHKENLVNAFWPRATVFVHVTRRDARGDPSPEYNAVFPKSTEAKLRRAAVVVGAEERNIKILEGPNAELPKCPNYEDNYRERRNATGHVQSMAHLLSLAGQLSHREGCMVLIRKEEVRAGHDFDVAVFVRADITIYFAFKPYCMYNLQRTRRVRDWFYLMPRAATDVVVSQPYNLFYNCTQGLKMGANVDEYIAPFIREATEDSSLPIMITRLDQEHFPNNMCDRFGNLGARDFDPEPEGQLCGPMTYKSPFNKPVVAGMVYPPVPQMACAAFPTPAVAVCAHGSARSFASPLVRNSLRDNLLRAFGASATLFLHLREDAADGADERLQGVLGQLNTSMGRPVHVEVAPPDRHLPPCAVARASSSEGWAAFFDSLHDDLSQRAGCMSLIKKEEQAVQRRFDAVVVVRADAVVFAPVRPFCMYSLRRARRFRDWLFLAPRADAEGLFQRPAERFQACGTEVKELKEADTLQFMDPFMKECVMDESLPVMLVGATPKTRDSNGVCKYFHNLGALEFDPKPEELCANMTTGNGFLAREGVL